MGEPRRGTRKGRLHSRRDPAGGSGTPGPRYYVQGNGVNQWFEATDWQEEAIDYYKLYESRGVQEMDSTAKGYYWLGRSDYGKIMTFTHNDQIYILTQGLQNHEGQLKILNFKTRRMRFVYTAEELETLDYGYHHKGAKKIDRTGPDYEQYCLCCRCGKAFVL